MTKSTAGTLSRARAITPTSSARQRFFSLRQTQTEEILVSLLFDNALRESNTSSLRMNSCIERLPQLCTTVQDSLLSVDTSRLNCEHELVLLLQCAQSARYIVCVAVVSAIQLYIRTSATIEALQAQVRSVSHVRTLA
jgi:hypothetical protein